MKRLQYTLLALAVATMAACEESSVFYATTYPIVQVEVTVEPETITPPALPEEEEPTNPEEPTTPEEPTDPPTPEPNPAVSVIKADVLANAPVAAGGSYTLDFTKYNGGPLRVRTSANAATTNGTFVKRPASDSLAFRFNDLEYVCVRGSYKDGTGAEKVLLTIDLTAHYQRLLPNDKITKVLRMEYSSANAK